MPHVSVYVDESGDMGFTEKSSKFFTVGYAFTINKFPMKENKKIQRILKNINTGIKKQNKKILEFKFSANTDTIKKKFLRAINHLDIEIGVICISKDSVKAELRKDPCRFYRYVIIDTIITNLSKDYVKSFDNYNSIRFTIDRSLSNTAIKSFNEYCENKLEYRVSTKGNSIEIVSKILHEDSTTVPMLQVTDYIASSTQRMISQNDPTFYNMFSEKLKYREKWDWNNKILW